MDRDAWLAQVVEPILEPDLPICDPHHHLWDFPGRRYLLDELLADLNTGHNIVSTVFVECRAMYRASGPVDLRPLGETEFVNGVAAMSASGGYGSTRIAAGIVSFADLRQGDQAGAVLDAHAAASGRFRGVRHAASWDASDEIRNSHNAPAGGLFLDRQFRRGLAEVDRRGLSFEAWLYHPQLPELTDLATAFPNLTIVLNHFGGPLGIGPYANRRAEIFAFWRAAIRELAKRPNVVAKLGGLVMPMNGFGFHERDSPPTSTELAAATRDWHLHTIDCFGPDRCLFESNFPVDKQSCSYQVLWNSFKRLAAEFTPHEKAALFHDTASRVYRLEPETADSAS